MPHTVPQYFRDPESPEYKQALDLVVEVTEYFYQKALQQLALELKRVFKLNFEQALALAEYYLVQFGW